ncbi:MAG: single-stranded-DNA-specific exonuclease RecJ [Clostridia bacterium]|nr:single-stranded-DNA-specific exonuclease RecJ [Clostridia bacterium]
MIYRKKWLLKDYDKAAANEISEALSVHPVTAALLVMRGCTDKKSALNFINKENTSLHDPFLFEGMSAAVLRIEKACEKNEKVVVYGDYDVDGITGTSILVKFLRSLGLDASYHIPERLTEGYGVNSDAIRLFASKGVTLVITVDTGITAVEEAALAKELGIDFIITDHHECKPELPDAVAVIDPKIPGCGYPFKDLAGVGVAFKLICAYNCYAATGQTAFSQDDKEIIFDALQDCFKKYCDIAALGTIADVMPVTGENRLIIAYGLNKMKKTKNKGLSALLKAAELMDENGEAKKITASNIGFIIAPRINAAGRLGSASRAVDMFLTASDEEAEDTAAWLCEKNKERQSEELEILKDAEAQIEREVDLDNEKIIILSSDSWHHGVIGIVSSRITEKYHRPSILISFDGSEDEGKGSGRSIDCFDLLEAITHCSSHLIRFGGHKHAAGLSLNREDFDAFKRDMLQYASSVLSDEDLIPETYADTELCGEDISMQLVNDLSGLEPFGEGNPVPLFLITDVQLTEIIPLKEGKHTRLCFTKDGKLFSGIYFGMNTKNFPYLCKDKTDVLFNLTENEFRGSVSAQIIIRDIRFSDSFYEDYEADINVYEYIKNDIILPQKEHIPDRESCSAVFKLIKKYCSGGQTCELNLHKIVKSEIRGIGYIRLRLILDIFKELHFLSYRTENGIVFSVKLDPSPEKAPLTNSKLFAKLNSQNV